MIMKMRDMLKRKNGQKGFTLVELIVVMAILAILAAIAVPRYTSVQEKAKLSAHMANIRTIESAIMVYDVSNNGDLSGCDADADSNGPLVPSYLQEWPTSPGSYSVTDGVLTASPTKAATKAA